MWALVALVCIALLGWMTLAVYFSPLEPPWMRAALAALVPIGVTIALILVRPLRRVSAMVLRGVVVVLDDATRASQVEPFSVYPPAGSDNPRDLWKWMAAYEGRTGGNVLAIAHNCNLSNGVRFPHSIGASELIAVSKDRDLTPRSALSTTGASSRSRPRAGRRTSSRSTARW
jgi:hypothetical protein